MKKKLRLAFKELAETSIKLNDYRGKLSDIAFDLSITDSFIAGIADRILGGDLITSDEIALLRKPFLHDETFWTTTDGLCADLEHSPELLGFASKIEEVRRICSEFVRQ